MVDLKYLKEINEYLIRDLSAIHNIGVSLGIKCLLESSVGGYSTVLSIIFLEDFINSQFPALLKLTEDSIHKLGNRYKTIVISIEA